MGRQIRVKLNEMLNAWPRGTVATYAFFKRQNISHQLVAKYLKGGWIKKIASGAYRRFDDPKITWQGGVYALQKHNNLPVHVGGVKALELAGYAHYVSPGGKSVVWLFGRAGTVLPSWFRKTDWGTRVKFQTRDIFTAAHNADFAEKEVEGHSIRISSPERAILETLASVPQAVSFEHAHHLMEGLLTLRPEPLRDLLRDCKLIKVKRLFLFLAEHIGLPVLKHINTKGIDIGKGFRSIVKPGLLDTKYLITVPVAFLTKHEK
jgi:hypothetical protein